MIVSIVRIHVRHFEVVQVVGVRTENLLSSASLFVVNYKSL